MSYQSLTISQELKQGYTHFWMGKLNDPDADQFEVIPLEKEKLEYCIKRSENADFDIESIADTGDFDSDQLYGKKPILCEKPYSPTLSSENLEQFIIDQNEDNDMMVPAVLQAMAEHLKSEEKFIAGVALINEAMSTYRSFQDAGILVTLD